MDRAHRPARIWWAPWRRRCGCGVHRWPCQDGLVRPDPPPAYWLSLHNKKAHWIDDPQEPPGPPAAGHPAPAELARHRLAVDLRDDRPACPPGRPHGPGWPGSGSVHSGSGAPVPGPTRPAGPAPGERHRRTRQRRSWPWSLPPDTPQTTPDQGPEPGSGTDPRQAGL